jgi:UDP-N-acetyl-D-glucosamine dehydrogenase
MTKNQQKAKGTQTAAKDRLLEKIRSHDANVGVIGLGYVGLPLVLRFAEENFTVTGFDIDPDKVKKLNAGESYIKHIPTERIKKLRDMNKFEATTDYEKLSDMDCVIICVPTPLTEKKEPDMRFVKATAIQVVPRAKKGQLVVLESTTYPGTTREELLPAFKARGLEAGNDFFLAYSPEREDPGNGHYTTKNIPKVVGGITKDCTDTAAALYGEILDQTVEVSSPEVAEFTKLLENIFRAVNIALVNELKILAGRMNVDIWEVIDAASTKPFGFMRFEPGPGLGGHCIPIDPFYLSWKARELDFSAHFIELAGEVNTGMPGYVIDKLSDALNCNGRCFSNSKILVLGIGYKRNTDDIRESPALAIIETLKDKNADVYYHDPYVPKIPKLRKHDLEMESQPLSEEFLKSMDAVLLVTDHSDFDYDWVVDNSTIFLDTRNAAKNVQNGRERIIKA